MKQYRVIFWKGRAGWRWRLVAPNGKMTAESGGDGYKRLGGAIRGFERTRDKSPRCRWEIIR